MNKKQAITELEQLKSYWGMSEETLQDVVDYIMPRPHIVRKDLYTFLVNTDLPELRS